MSAKREPNARGNEGLAVWAGLYVSGVLLVVFVLGHLAAVHYARDIAAEPLSFSNVSSRMGSPLIRWLDLGLLATVLLHGLVGTYRFIDDLGLCGRRSLAVVRWILVSLGGWGLAYGGLIFRAFCG
jgi:succinate dehydrogenase hydrophobic anchor subunit